MLLRYKVSTVKDIILIYNLVLYLISIFNYPVAFGKKSNDVRLREVKAHPFFTWLSLCVKIFWGNHSHTLRMYSLNNANKIELDPKRANDGKD